MRPCSLRFIPILVLFIFLTHGLFLTAQTPPQNHVIVIAFENHSYEDVVKSSSMPYFNNTLIPNGALATNFYANLHGSLANYLWVTMGTSLCGTSGPPYNGDPNCADGTLVTADKNNLIRQLLASGKTWKAYQEGMANQGEIAEGETLAFSGCTGTNYVPRHNPTVYFSDVRQGVPADATCSSSPSAQLSCPNSSLQGCNEMPYGSNFRADLNNHTLPNFSFVTPDMVHDAHDGTIGDADNWMSTEVNAILNSSYFQPGGDGLLIVWWDEGSLGDISPEDDRCSSGVVGNDPETGISCGGRIAVVMAGPKVKRGFQSTTYYQHQNLLRTIGEALGIGSFPGASAGASDMADMFGSGGGVGSGGANNLEDGSWACSGNCAAAVLDSSRQFDDAAKKFTYTGGAAFSDATWSTNPAADFSGGVNFTLDYWSQTDNPTASQAFEVHAIQVVGGRIYPFLFQCDFQDSQLWRVYDPQTDSWIPTSFGCAVIDPANSWDHFVYHFSRVGTQLQYKDIVINDTVLPINITVNSLSDTDPTSMTVELKLIGNQSGTGYSWWIDLMSLSF
jgi:acid phosphatase